jgi:hypothetical protein
VSLNVSKRAFIAGWIISLLPSLMMLMGVTMLFQKADEKTLAALRSYGWEEKQMFVLILVETCFVVLYLVPQTAVLGAILLTGYLGGATATHWRVSDFAMMPMPIIVAVLVWLGLFLRDSRVRALVPLRKR